MEVYVMLPTYNEKDNVRKIVPKILSQRTDIKIVAVDDNSPDGTGKILDELTKEYAGRIVVIHREQRGRGTAGIAGLKKALEFGAEYIFEMDADGSHDPAYINELLKIVTEENYDIAIGSRYIPGGNIPDRSAWRNITSDIANFYNQFFLGLKKIKDTSGGYKCYKRKVLEAIDLDTFVSRGYSIGAEILFRANKKNFKMKETPIIFHDRMEDKSKAGISEYFRYVWTVFVIWLGSLINIKVFHLMIAGILSALVNLFLFLWLVQVQKMNYLAASAISVSVNMFLNLFAEKIYESLRRQKSKNKYSKFFISTVATILLNMFLLWLMIDIAGFSILVSAISVIFIIAGINFILNRAWVFVSPARAQLVYKEIPAEFYEDQLGEKYGKFRAWYHNKRYQRLREFIEGKVKNIPNAKVADLGCGSCSWNTNKIPVTGVDINIGMLEVGKKAGRLSEIKETMLEDTGIPSSTFDIVVTSEVLEHIFVPEVFLKEVNRILKPGGQFLITVPYDFFPSPFYILFNIHCFIRGYLFEDEYYKHKCGHVNHFTKTTLKKLLSQNNFKVDSMFIVNSFLIYTCAVKE